MADSSYARCSFLGGEWSQTAQGRFDEPAYATSMNVCLNGFPIEQGAWTRRGGTQFLGTTSGGGKGRVYDFAVSETNPFIMEFTNGSLRFFSFGALNSNSNSTSVGLVTTNSPQAVSAISTATPAVVTTAAAHGWATGAQVVFYDLGVNDPLLQNVVLAITVLTSTTFSIADSVTGDPIDGATLGTFVSGNVAEVLQLSTIYTGGSWSSLISVQAENQAILLNGQPPQVLTMETPPTDNLNATFSIAAAVFLDGPYLDAFSGSICTYNATSGNVTLTFSFQTYSSTTSYSEGDYAEYSGNGYMSLQSANLNNTPSSSPTWWEPVNSAAPVGPNGFTNADIGRHIRLFSEPPPWSSSGLYAALAVVTYNDSYWQALNSTAAAIDTLGTITGGTGGTTGTYDAVPLTGGNGSNATANITVSGGAVTAVAIVDPGDGYEVGDTLSAKSSNIGSVSGFSVPVATICNTGIVPGTDVNNWTPVAGATYAGWTWGRIISVSGTGLISVATAFGTVTNPSNAFNGNVSQASADCAIGSDTVSNPAAWSGQGVPYTAGTNVFYEGANYECIETFTEWNSSPDYSVGAIVEYEGNYYKCIFEGANHGVTPGTNPAVWGALGGATPANTVVWEYAQAALGTSLDASCGGNFSAGAQEVSSVTIIPSTDLGFGCNITANLRASNTAPSSPSNGTLLGTATQSQFGGSFSISSNSASSWDYVWVEIIASNAPEAGSFTLACYLAQVEFFTPNVDNGSVVTIQLVGPALLYPTGTVVYTWQAGLYTSSVQPTCGCYHEGRLWLGGAVDNRWDASQSNNIFTMSPTEVDGTITDADGISAIADSDGVNATFWMATDALGIIVGTESGEWLIQASTPGTAITPTNIQAHRVTKATCAPIEPVRTEHTLVAVQRRMRKVFEYFADVFSGKFSAPNIIDKARHLTVNFIQEIRYQEELTPTVWARCGDGSLIGCTYRRNSLMTSTGPTFNGWHRHTLGSGRVVESITVGPSQGGTLDALVMVTNDPTTNVRHVELLTDFFEETDNILYAWQLDDAIAPTSYVVGADNVTFNGLSYLNGKTVTVFAAGLDCGDFTVASGAVVVPYGDGISEGAGGGLFTEALVNSFGAGQMPAVIGFTFTSQGQLTRPMTPQESGARTGPALAKKRRLDQYGALITVGVGGMQPETTTAAGLQFGAEFTNLYPAAFRENDDVTPLPFGTTFQGVHWDTLDDTSSFDGMLCWSISRPWPALIAAIEPFGASQDK